MIATATAPAPANFQTYQDRKSMTIEADEYLFILKEFHRLLRRTLNATAYALFCAIEDHAGPTEKKGIPSYTCTASQTTLADEINVKRITVLRNMKVLQDSRLIEIDERDGETSFIRPVATSEQRAQVLLNNGNVNDTCIKKIQATYPNLLQNDTGTCIKKIQPPVSKRYTNVTNLKRPIEREESLDTDVSNGPSGPTENISILNSENNIPDQETASVETAPPPDRRGFKQRWREAYEAVKDDFRARSGVMGGLWTEVTGIPPDYKQLNRLAKDYNSMWAVCEGIFKLANYEIVDDPLVFLRKVLSNDKFNTGGVNRGRSERPAGKNSPHPAPTGSKPTSDFKPGFWEQPDAEEQIISSWHV
jgi:hypothetical protein